MPESKAPEQKFKAGDPFTISGQIIEEFDGLKYALVELPGSKIKIGDEVSFEKITYLDAEKSCQMEVADGNCILIDTNYMKPVVGEEVLLSRIKELEELIKDMRSEITYLEMFCGN